LKELFQAGASVLDGDGTASHDVQAMGFDSQCEGFVSLCCDWLMQTISDDATKNVLYELLHNV